eukprot:SAG25_NODE_6089_length_589_cov_0.940816_1_plen_35_part_10
MARIEPLVAPAVPSAIGSRVGQSGQVCSNPDLKAE